MSEQQTTNTADATPTEAPAEKVVTAQIYGVEDSDMRTVVLAHPLTREQDFVSLGLDQAEGVDMVRGLMPGTKIRVRTEHATSLIGAGMVAGVDPDNARQVKDVVSDDTFAEKAAEDVAEQPAEQQAAVVVEKSVQQAEAPATGGTVEAAGAGSTGDTAPADPAATAATQTASKSAGRAGR